MRKAIVIAALLMILVIGLTANQQGQPVVLTNDSDKWVDCPGMPRGCQALILYGDVTKPAEFAVRFKYQAHYRIGPHIHDVDEHATVISGGPFHIAVGDTFDTNSPSKQTLNTGDLMIVSAGIHHFAWTDSDTILQVNGIGPFKRTFVNPADNSSGVPQ